MYWKIKNTQQPNSLVDLQKMLLGNRHVTDSVSFFSPPHPLDLTPEDVGIDPAQLAAAVARLELAKTTHEKVVVFGDYDVDGICSTAILWEGLRSFGILADPFIPDRLKHGYGLSEKSLAAVLEAGTPDLVISVDNGIVAHAPFQALQKLGIDAIITDHHQPEMNEAGEVVFPPAVAVIHTTQLCGATVAWFLARELSRTAAKKSLDLTAVATVADQMPLLAANRAFVWHGLVALQQTERVGIQLLCAKAKIEQQALTANSINYAIGPRINAMGRLKHGLDALRLLCTTNLERAETLVNELNDTNTTRQELTSEMIEDAVSQAETWKDQHIIIVSSPNYHEGVVGLIAGKLVEAYAKPAIVIAENETMGKASARSVAGVNIVELIRQVRDDLLEVGGHPLAAGFGVSLEKIAIVKDRLEKIALLQITQDMLLPSLEVELVLPAKFLTVETAASLDAFAPFGQLNREPVFGLENLQIAAVQKIGQEGKHLKLMLQIAQHPEQQFTALAWNKAAWADEFLPGQLVKVAATLEINEWRHRQSLQLMIKDVVAV